jgi:hypothetical protein
MDGRDGDGDGDGGGYGCGCGGGRRGLYVEEPGHVAYCVDSAPRCGGGRGGYASAAGPPRAMAGEPRALFVLPSNGTLDVEAGMLQL